MKSDANPDLPPVDAAIVAPESRAEIIGGFLVMSPPANEPHATLHLGLAYVLAAHVVDGYTAALDMLTRTSERSNFAPDASVYPTARDPKTGGRQLEELAFEIADTEPIGHAGEKARELVRRGVRRVFCIVIAHARVLEWSEQTDTWSPLPPDASIEDVCFVRPLPLHALVHAVGRDAAVVAALDARKSPALDTVEARGEARGEARALVTVLQSRGMTVDGALSARILSAPADTVQQWLIRAATATSLDAVFGAPDA